MLNGESQHKEAETTTQRRRKKMTKLANFVLLGLAMCLPVQSFAAEEEHKLEFRVSPNGEVMRAFSPKGQSAEFIPTDPATEFWLQQKYGEELTELDPMYSIIEVTAAGLTMEFPTFLLKDSSGFATTLYIPGLEGIPGLETTYKTEAKESNGRVFVSFNEVRLLIQLPGIAPPVKSDFSIWVAYPKPGEDKELVLRYSGSSYRVAEVEIDGEQFIVALVNITHNYSTMDDWWVIFPKPEASNETYRAEPDEKLMVEVPKPDYPRFINGNQGYRLEMTGELSGILRRDLLASPPPTPTPIPTLSRVSDEEYATLKWEHISTKEELEVALSGVQGRALLFWEAEWCDPCHQMEREVFKDREVFDALRIMKVIRADADEAYLLRQELKVEGLPTVHIFGSDGTEYGRIVGMDGVEKFIDPFHEAMARREAPTPKN